MLNVACGTCYLCKKKIKTGEIVSIGTDDLGYLVLVHTTCGDKEREEDEKYLNRYLNMD